MGEPKELVTCVYPCSRLCYKENENKKAEILFYPIFSIAKHQSKPHCFFAQEEEYFPMLQNSNKAFNDVLMKMCLRLVLVQYVCMLLFYLYYQLVGIVKSLVSYNSKNYIKTFSCRLVDCQKR